MGKLLIIGFLGAGTPVTWKAFIAAFESRLKELGWIDGRTVALQIRWAEGHSERYPEIAAAAAFAPAARARRAAMRPRGGHDEIG